jgi:Transposase DDE domain
MNAFAGAHDAAVQIIDTSIVRVHQHGACITRNRRQSMGRSRGGLTSKIHAVVDTNGLPVRLALTAGEAHDSLYTAQRRGDVVRMGRQHIGDGVLTVRPKKTERTTGIALAIPVHPHLQAVLRCHPVRYAMEA